jgi:prepilin-type N-terminal cleavage/methylation domain-containing protein
MIFAGHQIIDYNFFVRILQTQVFRFYILRAIGIMTYGSSCTGKWRRRRAPDNRQNCLADDGVTLVELIVVLCIFSILAAVGAGSYKRFQIKAKYPVSMNSSELTRLRTKAQLCASQNQAGAAPYNLNFDFDRNGLVLANDVTYITRYPSCPLNSRDQNIMKSFHEGVASVVGDAIDNEINFKTGCDANDDGAIDGKDMIIFKSWAYYYKDANCPSDESW